MRERIEQLGDILLAAAHADHHVEAAEIDKIEEILKGIWRQEPSPDSLVRRVTEFREGETIDAEEMARLGSVLRDLQPKDELPASLVQRLADFDPARFDIDEAVGPFLHESYEFKRKLLELAVEVHESDGELDFAEDTFIRELGYKLGLELHQFQDLLLEFLPSDARPGPNGAEPMPGARELANAVEQTSLLVPPTGSPSALLVPADQVGKKPKPKPKAKVVAAERGGAAAKKKAAKKKAAKTRTPASKKKTAKKKPAGGKQAKKPAAKKKSGKKKR